MPLGPVGRPKTPNLCCREAAVVHAFHCSSTTSRAWRSTLSHICWSSSRGDVCSSSSGHDSAHQLALDVRTNADQEALLSDDNAIQADIDAPRDCAMGSSHVVSVLRSYKESDYDSCKGENPDKSMVDLLVWLSSCGGL